MTPLTKRIVLHLLLPLLTGFLIYFFFRPDVAFVKWFCKKEPLIPYSQLNQLQKFLVYSGPDFCWSYSLSSALFLWERWQGRPIRYFPVLVVLLVAGSELIQGSLLKGFTLDVADIGAATAAFLLSLVLNRRAWHIKS